ncbi:MAG: DUF5671 domain-containing protein [Chloroflexota bacterium]|nr:DUF5671 domain-containing protein [Chloroflexota bacterium]MDE2886005.1 DUF5671 domain-containing protein [Chloroflexota bacterium]
MFSDFDFLIIPILAMLLLLGGAAGIVALALRSRGGGGDPGIGTTRRIFLYGLAFAALITAASGLALLTGALLTAVSGDVIAGEGTSALAFGIAAGGVGFAVWAVLWRAAQRSVERHPAEAGALGRKAYVYLVLGAAAITVAFSLTLFIGDLLDARHSPGLGDLAVPLVWAGVWAFHWRIESAEGQRSEAAATARRIYVYTLSIYGLILLAAGTAILGGSLLNAGYHTAFNGDNSPDGLPEAWSFFIVGMALWGTHWLWLARGDASGIRQAVLYVLGVFGGTAAATGALSTLLVIFTRWPLDPERGRSALDHFDPVPEAFAVLLVTAAVAAYHRRTALAEADAAPGEGIRAQRAYRYLSAAIGLGTLWVSLTLLIAVAVGLAVPSAQGSFIGERWWGLPLSIGVTLLVVGAALWGWHWPRLLGAARADADERTSLSRRAYLFTVFGVSVAAGLISLITLLYGFLEAALNNDLSTQVLDGGKWALGVVVTAAAVSVYHWLVLREDAAAAPPAEEQPSRPPAPPKRVTALVSAEGMGLVDALERALGTTIERRIRADAAGAPPLSDDEAAAMAERIREAPGEEVVLVVDDDGVRIVPL